MTLAEIRKQFVLLSGRYDLVTNITTFPNNDSGIGADWFIQQGQKFLDRLAHTSKHLEARWNTTLPAGQTTLTSPIIRAVKSVRLETSTASIFLDKVLWEDLRKEFGDIDGFPSITATVPRYFAPINARSLSAPDADTETEFGIFVMPPPDVNYTIEIIGLFESNPLEDDADVSYWSEARPETLINAAYYVLERFYRNTQGMQDHLAAIRLDLEGIDHDDVEEAIAGVDYMRDSWRFD